MIRNDIVNLFIKQGFQYAKDNVPNLYLFLKKTDETTLNICLFADQTVSARLSVQFMESISDALERKFLFHGFQKVSIFYMIFSNHIEQDKEFLNQPHNFWLIDTLGKRIMVFDQQPEDYFGLRTDLETLLFTPVKKELNNISRVPFMTILLVFINVIVFLFTSLHSGLQTSDYILEHGGAYWGYIYENHEYYRLLTCIFLHFNSEHLLNNMLSLALIGSAAEKALGHIRYVCIYLLSGLCSSILSSLYYMHNSPDIVTVSAGASGAIFGILGSLIIVLLVFRNKRREIQPVHIILIAILSIANGYLSSSTDNIGHIGGLLSGMILTFISCLYRKNILK